MTDSHGGEHVAVDGAPQGSVAVSKIVVIERHGSPLAATLAECLAGAGCELRVFASPGKALDALPGLGALVVLAECAAAGDEGPALVKQVAAADPRARTVLVVAQCSVPEAVAAMRAGAFGCLGKPVVAGELLRVIEAAARHSREPAMHKDGAEPARDAIGLEAIIGSSPPMVQLKGRLKCLVDAETGMRDREHAAVLITGETGTGKELAARALHFDGMRREGPFVEVNCSSLPLQLLESELFGHERGAFTDAKERKVGLVEAAEGGTLFLDEIGEVDLAIQAKLLKLLEERSVRRVGSTRERKVDVRIVSATNQDLERMVREGRFRSDLFFRLRIVTLHMPPLRERHDDVLPLARHFVALHGRRYGKKNLRLSPDAEAALLAHAWPGNVRELQNTLEQAVLLARADAIAAHDIALCMQVQPGEEPHAAAKPVPGWPLPERHVEHLSRARLEAAIVETGGNIARAARALGITRDTLRYQLRKQGLSGGRAGPPRVMEASELTSPDA